MSGDNYFSINELRKKKPIPFLFQLGLLDPHSTELFDQEERFAEIINEYELQCQVGDLCLVL